MENPYVSPTSGPQASSRTPEAFGPLAFWLTMVYPVLLLLDFAGSLELVPRFPMENFWLDVAITTAVFLLTVLAVPLAIAGLRTAKYRIATLALILGSIEVSMIYFVKFHPWVMRVYS